MIVILGFFGALLTELAAGLGFTMWLVRRRLRLTEHLTLAWLLGSSLLSFFLWLAGFVLHGPSLQLVVTTLSILLGWSGVVRWRSFPERDSRPRPKGAEVFFYVAIAAEIVVIILLSLQHTLGWDGLTVWELKARYAFLNGGVVPGSYFSDVSRWFSHPEYPLLLPLTESWFYTWIGECDQYWIKLLFPIWYVAGVCILLMTVQDVTGRRWIGRLIALLILLVPAVHSAPGGITVGYADVPLGMVYVAATSYLLQFVKKRSDDALALFIALAAILPWMKREGAILWFLLSAAGAIVLWHRGYRGRAALSFVPGALVVTGWRVFCSVKHTLPSRDFVPLAWHAFAAGVGHAGGIVREVCLTLLSTQLWDIFWVLVFIALVATTIRSRNAIAGIICWALLAPMACYTASYLFSAWPDYIAHMDTSLPRLLIQLTPIGWLLIAFVCGFTFPKQPGPPPISRSAPEMDCN